MTFPQKMEIIGLFLTQNIANSKNVVVILGKFPVGLLLVPTCYLEKRKLIHAVFYCLVLKRQYATTQKSILLHNVGIWRSFCMLFYLIFRMEITIIIRKLGNCWTIDRISNCCTIIPTSEGIKKVLKPFF